MSKSSRGTPAPSLGPDWTIQHVGQRTARPDETETCEQCAATLGGDDPYLRVEVARDVQLDGHRLRSEHEQHRFCDRTCASAWLNR